ncbi:hypothetical protein H489_0110105 [Curtobacterium flaccumfaciens UCD-AKU]|uniref:hypothetical protein n=1 Tax=Curtobacterium flaccumfaciens TaxID=2035 RepID=UPI00036C1F54|nr:hypothetical protein [Curtobacterium flaccumfaciens]EYT63781.1 hypothetical protein H489_0110105 [Curtobacterium flaccumfaciens UCD-AKU]
MNGERQRLRVLYVSDLGYEAKGRRYCDEDIYLSGELSAEFDVAICPPLAAEHLMDAFDVVVVRNSGPVLHYLAAYDAFREAARTRGIPVFTDLTGRADQRGKQYLLDLFRAGYPVIPTIDAASDIAQLPDTADYIAKPKLGADSIGLRVVGRDELAGLHYDNLLVQPRIDFQYEVSFYYVDHVPQYALNAPDPTKRWELQQYRASDDDWAFAQQFIAWNTIEHGVQRVDACRTRDGALLLVELEDLNPYLSLDLLDERTRTSFVAAVKESVRASAGKRQAEPLRRSAD